MGQEVRIRYNIILLASGETVVAGDEKSFRIGSGDVIPGKIIY